jgi:hypothetical protein
MTKSNAERRKNHPNREASRPVTEKRIDGRHALGDAEPAHGSGPSTAEQAAMAIQTLPPKLATASSAADHLRTQAVQLAEYLRTRQRDLDHREAQLNAQSAQIESGQRSARLWVSQRETEVEAQQQAMARRQTEIESAAAEVERRLQEAAEWEKDLQRRRDELDAGATENRLRVEEREQSLRKREAAIEAECKAARRQLDEGLAQREEQLKELALLLEARESTLKQYEESLARRETVERQKIEAEAAASAEKMRQALESLDERREAMERESGRPSPRLLERERRVAEAEALQAARRQQLDEVQAMWSEAQGEVEGLRQQLIEDRNAMEEQARAERQRMAADHRRALAEMEEQRFSLARRSEHVDQCRVALEQLRGEMGQMHRETLEIRLATEELWVQLSGTAPAATLTRSLGQVRAKLAEQYRMANAELAEQRKALDELRAQLAVQHEKLMVQKRDLDAWAGRRQEEIEQQAARLVAREQELERQDAEFQQRSRQLQIEELDYRREIFSLRAQLQQSQPDEPVATAS